jgi:hypothetical protein
MKTELLSEYKSLMIKTRFLGIVGSFGLLIVVMAELSEVEWNSSLNYRWVDVGLFVTSLSVGLVLLIRIFLLLRGNSWPYSIHSGTWIVVLTILILFTILWVYATTPVPDTVCEPQPDKVCYSILVSYRQSPLATSALPFLIVSVVRSMLTLTVAKVLLTKRIK